MTDVCEIYSACSGKKVMQVDVPTVGCIIPDLIMFELFTITSETVFFKEDFTITLEITFFDEEFN